MYMILCAGICVWVFVVGCLCVHVCMCVCVCVCVCIFMKANCIKNFKSLKIVHWWKSIKFLITHTFELFAIVSPSLYLSFSLYLSLSTLTICQSISFTPTHISVLMNRKRLTNLHECRVTKYGVHKKWFQRIF